MDEKINLNSFVYNKQITREDLLQAVTQEDVYSKYMGEDVYAGMKTHSPFREDDNPSFGFFYRRDKSGILMFNDLATSDSGDIVVFVMKLYGLSYKEALFKISYDFGFSKVQITEERKNIINAQKLERIKSDTKVGIKVRNWKKYDAKFWKSFNISKKTLKKYNVYPISYMFLNDNIIHTEKLAYAYLEFKDGKTTYKIYQPYSKDFKWSGNADRTVHQGYTQLPKKGKNLIITKSLKDVMSIRDTILVPSVALQSESILMKDSVMDEYKQRFENVYCLFDNDRAGRLLTRKFTERFDVPHLFMPYIDNVTDFSDYVKVVQPKKAGNLLKQLLKL